MGIWPELHYCARHLDLQSIFFFPIMVCTDHNQKVCDGYVRPNSQIGKYKILVPQNICMISEFFLFQTLMHD